MEDIFYKNNIQYKRFYYNNKPTNYFISEYGDVYNISTNHYLTQTVDCSGRKVVCLSISGESIPIRVHKLVALVFLGEIPSGMTIDHKDENFLNNHYSNLQFLSSVQNVLKYLDNNNGITKKYSDKLIHSICKDLKSGIYYRKLVDKYNVPLFYLYSIVHCNTRKDIVSNYLPFPETSYRIKPDKSNIKRLMTELIEQKYSNTQIYDELQLEQNNANSKLLYRIRKRLGIKEPKFLDDKIKMDVINLIKSGFSNKEILTMLHIEYNKQIEYLFGRTRQKLNIPDFNRDGVPIHIQYEIRELIKSGKSNKEILSKYGLERNKYTINLLGKLRQKVKKENSTTIENINDGYYHIHINI